MKQKSPYTRTRERSNGIAVVISTTGQEARTGSRSGSVYWSIGPFYGTKMYKSYEQMTDVVTPGFAQYASDRKLVNNPMTRVTHSETMSDSGYISSFTEPNGDYHRWFRTNCLSAYFGPVAPRGAQRVNVENLQNLCQTAALAGVDSPDMSSIPALVEVRKTLDLLAGPLNRLNEWMKDYESRIQQGVRSKFSDAYWKGKRTRSINGNRYAKSDGRVRAEPRCFKAENVGDFLADAVLSINLGWKPSLMEIDALLHKIPLREATPWQTSRATRADSSAWSETKVQTTGDGNVFTIRYDYTEKVTVRAGVVYEDDFSVAKHFGVRLSDVPEAMWEITRFSWLVDYVLNVGDYIGAIRASLESKVVNHFTVTTIEETCERTILNFSPPAPYTTVELKPSGGGSMSHTTKTRNPAAFIANFAYLPLEVTLKPSSHLQNVLSLLTSYLVDISRHTKVPGALRYR